MADKRRLPVLQPPPAHDDEARPPWHWIGFGTVAIFGAWLPLAYLAQAIGNRMSQAKLGDTKDSAEAALAVAALSPGDRSRLAAQLLVPHALALAVAAFAGGLLVGRFGRGVGVREAALAGVSAAMIAGVLSVATAGPSWAPLVTVLLAGAMASWGGAVGRRRTT